MIDPSAELKTAAFQRLTVGAAKISATVYESAPANTPLPYVELGMIRFGDWSTKKGPGCNVILTIDIWHDQPNEIDITAIVNDIYGSITFTNDKTGTNHLSLPSFNTVGQNRLPAPTNTSIKEFDSDDQGKHKVLEIEFILQES